MNFCLQYLKKKITILYFFKTEFVNSFRKYLVNNFCLLPTVLIKIAEPANVWHWGYHIPEPSSVTAL